MSRRQLNSDEKKLCEKNLKILEEEYTTFIDEEKICKAHLNFILEINYRKMRREFKKKLLAAEREIRQITQTISILKNQIKNGVDKKGGNDGN